MTTSNARLSKTLTAAAALTAALFLALPASAEVKTKTITYNDGETELSGLLAWDDSMSGPRPGVLVVHEWWGLNDYAKGRAEALAAEGYVAFAVDMYGTGKVTEHPDQAGTWAKEITANLSAWVKRAETGLEVLQSQDQVQADKLAAIGYCFGGSTVMQMAYADSPLKAVASFHGSLPPASEDVTKVNPRVLIAHGRDDSFIPAERVIAFQDALDRTEADWEMTIYANTRHGFTNPDAGKFGIENLAYNEVADRRSWAATLQMLEEVF